MVYKQQTFTSHCPWSWEVYLRKWIAPSGESPFSTSFTCLLSVQSHSKRENQILELLNNIVIASHDPVTSHRSQLICLMFIKFSTYAFWEDIHTQILAPHWLLTFPVTQCLNASRKNYKDVYRISVKVKCNNFWKDIQIIQP